ncbi:MAG: response regulator transcription factor [Methylococcaceae bacterium]|nr:MAG: response regulator transcription factor [Methylococcaceae bacterium]
MSSLPQILIIDDDIETVRILVELLRGRGFALRTALDGRDGHRKAVAGDPDVILLDVSMPEMDGHHVCRLLKNDPRTADIPVIFLTGRDGAPDKLEGFEAGGSDYVTKPFSADELTARIHVHLHVRRRLRSKAAPPDDAPPAPPSEFRSERLLSEVQSLLLADLAHPPPLVELARQVGTNERSLTELFRRRLGMPVFAWLREERWRKACELLLESDKDIAVIAVAVGYANPAAFATAFRERYGITPSAYRRSAGLIEPGPCREPPTHES